MADKSASSFHHHALNKSIGSLVALIAALASSTALAQTPLVLPDVVVSSAHQVPLESSHVASSVTVLQGDDLRARGFQTVADALRGVPGVTVSQAGSRGGLTQLRMRGSEANHVLTLIDGVPANRVDAGDFDYANFGIEAVERIEIIRGPQSGLFGAQAHSGVVSIVTKSGRGLKRPIFEAKAETGSMGTNAGAVGARGALGPFYGSITVEDFKTNGYNIARTGSERDGNRSNTITTRVGADLTSDFNIDSSWRANHRRLQFDQEGFAVDPLVFDSFGYDRFDTVSGRTAATLKTFDGRWVHRLGYSTLKDDYSDEIGFGPFQTRGTRGVVDYKSTFNFNTGMAGGERHALSFLVDDEREHYNTNFGANQHRERNGLATEYLIDFASGLTLSGALRKDWNDQFGDPTTWRVTANQRIVSTGTRLHGSYGTGATNPTFAEQFGQTFNFRGNPSLQPESSRGWDAGIEQSFFGNRLVIDNTYFHIDAEDEIIAASLGGGLSTVVNNPGIAKRHGLETTATLRVFDWLSLAGGHTYTKALRSDGTPEEGRPEHTAYAQLNAMFAEGRGRFTIDARRYGTFEDRANLPPTGVPQTRVVMAGFSVVSAQLSYEFYKGVTAYVRGENIFDEQYEELYSYRSPGSAVYGGLRVKFGE